MNINKNRAGCAADLFVGSWLEKQDVNAVGDYLSKVYQKLLPLLKDKLNAFHQVDRSERYWAIIIGSWLMHYVHVMYDRYCSIRELAAKGERVNKDRVWEGKVIMPRDTKEYLKLVIEDGDNYNQQIYAQLLFCLASDSHKHLPLTRVVVSQEQPRAGAAIMRKIKSFAKRIKNRKIEAALFNSYFPSEISVFLGAESGGKIGNIYIDENVDLRIKPDMAARLSLRLTDKSFDEFAGLISRLIPFYLPISYVEGYGRIRAEALGVLWQRPKIILSASSWHFDEVFKSWAAEMAEGGTLLIGAQHGGNYGLNKIMFMEKHEISLVDYFYSWGWDSPEVKGKIRPFCATKLAGMKTVGANNRTEGVTLVTTSIPRYFFRLQYLHPYNFRRYLLAQETFVRDLPEAIRKKLRVRAYQTDYGWGTKRWLNDFPEVTIEGWETPFLASMAKSRLMVCDHLCTTFMEYLAADKPVILMGEVFELTPEAARLIKRLENAGIYYQDSSAAAKAIENIYRDIETWWQEPGRQEAAREFKHYYARTTDEPAAEWLKEFHCLAGISGQKFSGVKK